MPKLFEWLSAPVGVQPPQAFRANMRQLDRSFTDRHGGRSSLRQLLGTAVKRGLIELDRRPNDFVLRLVAQVAPGRAVARTCPS